MSGLSDLFATITGVGGTLRGIMDKLDTNNSAALLAEIRDNTVAINQKLGAIREAIELPGETLTLPGGAIVQYNLLNYLRQQLGLFEPADNNQAITANVWQASERILRIRDALGPYPYAEAPTQGNFLQDIISRATSIQTSTAQSRNYLLQLLNVNENTLGTLSSMQVDYELWRQAQLTLLEQIRVCMCETDPDPDPDPDPGSCPDCDPFDGNLAKILSGNAWEYHPETRIGGTHCWKNFSGGGEFWSTATTIYGVEVFKPTGLFYETCYSYLDFVGNGGTDPLNRLAIVAYTSLEDMEPTTIVEISQGEENGCGPYGLGGGDDWYSVQCWSTNGVEPNQTPPTHDMNIWITEVIES